MTREELQTVIASWPAQKAQLYAQGQTLREEQVEIAKELATVASQITAGDEQYELAKKELSSLEVVEKIKNLTQDFRLWTPAYLETHPGDHHPRDVCAAAEAEGVIFKTIKGKDLPYSSRVEEMSKFIRNSLVLAGVAYISDTRGKYGWGKKPEVVEKTKSKKKQPQFRVLPQTQMAFPQPVIQPTYDENGLEIVGDERYRYIVEAFILGILSGAIQQPATRKTLTVMYLEELKRQKLSPKYHSDLMREVLDVEAQPGGRLDGFLKRGDQKTPVNAEMTYVPKGTPGPQGQELHVPAVQPKPPLAVRRGQVSLVSSGG